MINQYNDTQLMKFILSKITCVDFNNYFRFEYINKQLYNKEPSIIINNYYF